MEQKVVSPEVYSAVRTLLVAIGGFAVGKDWIDLDANLLSELAGAILVILIGGWSIFSKRPASSEAQTIAERVAESPQVPAIVKAEIAEKVEKAAKIEEDAARK